MKLEEFIIFISGLPKIDRLYIEPRLIKVMEQFRIEEIVRLQSLYENITTKNSDNIYRDIPYRLIQSRMNEWCIANCTGIVKNITVTNWAFQRKQDAMWFRLVWDKDYSNDMAL